MYFERKTDARCNNGPQKHHARPDSTAATVFKTGAKALGCLAYLRIELTSCRPFCRGKCLLLSSLHVKLILIVLIRNTTLWSRLYVPYIYNFWFLSSYFGRKLLCEVVWHLSGSTGGGIVCPRCKRSRSEVLNALPLAEAQVVGLPFSSCIPKVMPC